MPLEPIRRRAFPEPDRAELQESVIRRVEENPEKFLKKYEELPQSHNGRYINSDLFKEIFPEYAESKETKARYNTVVHNASAALAAEQLRKVIADPMREGDKVVYLTGIPGAGKTSSIKERGELPPTVKAVYEGQLADANFAIPKIQTALDVGLKPVIVAVHTPPERALKNTFTRFNDMGRGANIHTMAKIQGDLPSGLTKIREHFGDAVSLRVVDKTDAKKTINKDGWEHLSTLQKEGDYDNIKQRLSNANEHAHRTGRISKACYDQAHGRVPEGNFSRFRGLAGKNSGGTRQDESG